MAQTVKQIYETLHDLVDQTLGREDILKTDLTNLADVGRELFDAEKVDSYLKKLVVHIGKVMVVNRVYDGQAPKVMMDGWEFGAALEKIDIGLPKATKNESWDLRDGASYDPNIFHSPKARVKFFTDSATYDYEMSFPVDQVKMSFSNATQMSSFLGAVENKIRMAKTMDFDNLTMATISYSMSATIASAFPNKEGTTDYSDVTSVKAINVLKEYNDTFHADGQNLMTVEMCMYDLDFLKFATKLVALTSDRLEKASVLFNESGDKDYPRFTPKRLQHIVLLSEFAKSADIYLQSDTYHNELTKLPEYEVVTYWQGSGEDYSFENTSEIHTVITDPNDPTTTKEVHISGIIGTIFDRDRLAVCNPEDNIDTNYNGKARFFNYFYHAKSGRIVDYNENAVVFFVA